MELDLLFEVTPGHRKVTEIVEYGDNLSDIMNGKMSGSNGACFDLHVVADTTGKLTGKTRAIVTMFIKPNGETSLNLREALTLTTGECIHLEGTGISLPGEKPGWVKAKGSFKFFTTSKSYDWVNTTMAVFEAWGDPGLMNIALTAVSITDPVFVPHRIMKKPLAA